MISYYSILTILLCHFISDFHFQSDRMAKGKSSSNGDLFDHTVIVTIGILVMGILNFKSFDHAGMLVAFVAINGFAHFFTDYYSSRSTSRLYKDQEFHDFFGTIGLDQFVHYVTLFGTFIWLTNK